VRPVRIRDIVYSYNLLSHMRKCHTKSTGSATTPTLTAPPTAMPTPEVIDPGHSIEDEKDGSSTTVTSRNGEVTKLANKRRGRAMSDRRCGASKGHKELHAVHHYF
jgi:hypothetical protein